MPSEIRDNSRLRSQVPYVLDLKKHSPVCGWSIHFHLGVSQKNGHLLHDIAYLNSFGVNTNKANERLVCTFAKSDFNLLGHLSYVWPHVSKSVTTQYYLSEFLLLLTFLTFLCTIRTHGPCVQIGDHPCPTFVNFPLPIGNLAQERARHRLSI